MKRNRTPALEWFREQKEKDVCNNCGFGHPAAIEYHHVDPKTKIDSVSSMVHNGLDITVCKREMEKCRPLCRNCHAIHHYNEKHNVPHHR